MSLEGTLFDECIQTVFAHWDVLRTVVESEMGGEHSQEKAEWMPSVIVELFEKEGESTVVWYYLICMMLLMTLLSSVEEMFHLYVFRGQCHE